MSWRERFLLRCGPGFLDGVTFGDWLSLLRGCHTIRHSGSTHWQWGRNGLVRIYVGEAANLGE